MFESVYVCRATQGNCITVVPASIGIVKVEGCVQFFCAIKDNYSDYGSIYDDGKETYISPQKCRAEYSSVPPKGTAWLVEESRKYINWTRVDHNIHLLNADGSIAVDK